MQHHPAPFHTKIYKGQPGYGHGIAIFSAESNTAIAQVHANPNTYPFADEDNVNDSACEATARMFREAPRMLLFLHEITERKDIPQDARNAGLTLLNRIDLAPNITTAPLLPAGHAATGEGVDIAAMLANYDPADERSPWFRLTYECACCNNVFYDESDEPTGTDHCPVCKTEVHSTHSDDITDEPETDGDTYVRCRSCGEFVIEGEWEAHCNNHV